MASILESGRKKEQLEESQKMGTMRGSRSILEGKKEEPAKVEIPAPTTITDTYETPTVPQVPSVEPVAPVVKTSPAEEREKKRQEEKAYALAKEKFEEDKNVFVEKEKPQPIDFDKDQVFKILGGDWYGENAVSPESQKYDEYYKFVYEDPTKIMNDDQAFAYNAFIANGKSKEEAFYDALNPIPDVSSMPEYLKTKAETNKKEYMEDTLRYVIRNVVANESGLNFEDVRSSDEASRYNRIKAIYGDRISDAQARAWAKLGYSDLSDAFQAMVSGSKQQTPIRSAFRNLAGDPWAEITKEESNKYFELLDKYGKQAADQYFKELYPQLLKRPWEKLAKDEPVLATAASIIASPLRGVSYAMQALDYLTGHGIDETAVYNMFSYIPSTIRGTVSEKIKEDIGDNFWGDAASFTYGLGTSMADSAFSRVFGPASLVIMGMGAAADMTLSAKQRGVDDGRALLLGGIAGAAEIITEKIKWDKLLDMDLKNESVRKYILQNATTEALEEIGADGINLVADVLLAKDKSEWAQSVEAYKNSGMSERDAFMAAFKDQAISMGLSGIGGFLSGGFMAGIGALGGKAYESFQNRQNRSIDAVANAIQNYPVLSDEIGQQTIDVETQNAGYANEQDTKNVIEDMVAEQNGETPAVAAPVETDAETVQQEPVVETKNESILNRGLDQSQENETQTVAREDGTEATVNKQQFNDFFADTLGVDTSENVNGMTVEQMVENAEKLLPEDLDELYNEVKRLSDEKKKGKGGLPLDVQLFAAKRKLAWKSLPNINVKVAKRPRLANMDYEDILDGDSTSRVYKVHNNVNKYVFSEVLSKEALDMFLSEPSGYNVRHDVERDAEADALIDTDDKKVALFNKFMTPEGRMGVSDSEVRAADKVVQWLFDQGEIYRSMDLAKAIKRAGTNTARALRAQDLVITDYSPVRSYELFQRLVDFALDEQLKTPGGNQAMYDAAKELSDTLEETIDDPDIPNEEKEKAVKDALQKIYNGLLDKTGTENQTIARAIKKAINSNKADFAKLFDNVLTANSNTEIRNSLAELLGFAYADADTQAKISELFAALKNVDEDANLSELDKTKVRYALTEQVYKLAAQQFPVSFSEKLGNYRRIAMLSSPKTHIKNFLSNVVNMPLRKETETVAQGIERLLNRINKKGKPLLADEKLTQRLGWTFTEHGKKIMDDVNADTEREMLELSKISKLELGGESSSVLKKYRQIFKSKIMQQTVGKLGDIESWLLEKGDNMFVKSAYRDALGQIMTARGATEITDEIRDIARQRALIATFKAENALSNVMNYIRSKGQFARFVADAIMPFTLTPTNIAMEAYRYSPVNVLVGTWKVASAIRNNKSGFEVAQAINSLAKGITGTLNGSSILLVGALLARLGIKVALPTDYGRSDKEKSEEELTGEQQYSLRIGNVNVSLDWIQPAAFPLIFGAAAYNAISGDDAYADAARNALVAGYDSISDMSTLKGIVDLVSGKSLTEGGLNVIEDFPASLYPALFSSVTRAFDPIKRNSKKSNAYQKVLGRLGITQGLEPELDIWGNPVYKTAAGSDRIGNAAINLFSPSTVTTGSEPDDELTKIILDMYENDTRREKSSMPSTNVSEWKLPDGTSVVDGGVATQAQQDLGKAYRDAAERLIFENGSVKIKDENGKDKVVTWDTATEEEQYKALTKVFDGANNRTRKQYEQGDEYGVKGVDPDDYNQFLIDTQAFVSEKDENDKTISGSLRDKYEEYIYGMDIDKEDKYRLMYNAGSGYHSPGKTVAERAENFPWYEIGDEEEPWWDEIWNQNKEDE